MHQPGVRAMANAQGAAPGALRLLNRIETVSKYDEVLRPFVALMEKELHANSHKGDREGWLQMSEEQAFGEIEYHVSKLCGAMSTMNPDGVREYAADVANLCMMLLDIGGQLKSAPTPPQPICDEAKERELFAEWWRNTPILFANKLQLAEAAWLACAQSRAKSVEVCDE